MPSLVKSNSALASGGIALLEQSVSTRSATELVITARYIALAAYSDKWAARLQPGLTSPVPLNYAGNALSVVSEPIINTISINVQAGLVYFECQLAASRAITTDGTEAGSSIITSSSTISLQSFSGSRDFTYNENYILDGIPLTRQQTFNGSISFDYYAESKTLSSSSREVFDVAEENLTKNTLYIGKAFNINSNVSSPNPLLGGPLNYTAVFINNLFISIAAEVVFSTSITKNANGSFNYQATGTVRMLQQPDSTFVYENPLTLL